MPLRKHEPVSEEEMNWISPRRTICQVLREIYFSVDDDRLKLKLREATSMAKAMTAKMLEDKPDDFIDQFWEENPEFVAWMKWKSGLKKSSCCPPTQTILKSGVGELCRGS